MEIGRNTNIKKLKVKFVIFDWSGTISNDFDACYDAAIRLRAHFGLPRPEREQWRKQTMSNAIDYLRLHGVKEDAKRILELYSRFYAQSPKRPKAFDDASEILSLLTKKGKTILVVSGHPEEHLMNEMAEYGFDRFISPDFVWGSTKNKAERLREVLNELDVNPSDAVYIGDMVWDVRAAKKAGVHSVALLRGYHKERLIDEKPDLLVESLAELKGHIV